MEFYGYSLRDAIMGDTRSLVNRGEPAWPAGYKMPQKLAIAVHVRHTSICLQLRLQSARLASSTI